MSKGISWPYNRVTVRLFSILLLCCAVWTNARADELSPPWWNSFHLMPLHAIQEGGRDGTSVGVGWSPSLSLGENWDVVGNLGGTLMKGRSGSLFPLIELWVSVRWTGLEPIFLEPGLGFQDWEGNGGVL